MAALSSVFCFFVATGAGCEKVAASRFPAGTRLRTGAIGGGIASLGGRGAANSLCFGLVFKDGSRAGGGGMLSAEERRWPSPREGFKMEDS